MEDALAARYGDLLTGIYDRPGERFPTTFG